MRWGRGLFRFWLLLSVLWTVAVGVWLGREAIQRRFTENCLFQRGTNPGSDNYFGCFDEVVLLSPDVEFAAWMLGPPLAGLVVGILGYWVIIGFRGNGDTMRWNEAPSIHKDEMVVRPSARVLTMNHWGAFGVTVVATVVMVAALRYRDIAMTMLDGRGMVRLVGEVAGGAIALLGVGWAVAGLVYLVNRQAFTRSILAWIAIFVAAIFTYFAYLGRSL